MNRWEASERGQGTWKFSSAQVWASAQGANDHRLSRSLGHSGLICSHLIIFRLLSPSCSNNPHILVCCNQFQPGEDNWFLTCTDIPRVWRHTACCLSAHLATMSSLLGPALSQVLCPTAGWAIVLSYDPSHLLQLHFLKLLILFT